MFPPPPAHLHPAEQLVEEVRHSVVVQLYTDHPTQVSVHQLHHYVPVCVFGRESVCVCVCVCVCVGGS